MKKTLIALIAFVGSAGADVITAVDGVYTFGADDWADTTLSGLSTSVGGEYVDSKDSANPRADDSYVELVGLGRLGSTPPP